MLRFGEMSMPITFYLHCMKYLGIFTWRYPPRSNRTYLFLAKEHEKLANHDTPSESDCAENFRLIVPQMLDLRSPQMLSFSGIVTQIFDQS